MGEKKTACLYYYFTVLIIRVRIYSYAERKKKEIFILFTSFLVQIYIRRSRKEIKYMYAYTHSQKLYREGDKFTVKLLTFLLKFPSKKCDVCCFDLQINNYLWVCI